MDFDHALAIDSSLAMVYYNRGLAYVSLKQPQQALTDYDRALELAPHLYNTYSDRASVYETLKMYHEAVNDYTLILERNPNDTLATFSRGTMYLYLDEPLKAIEDFDRLIKLYPGFACAYNNRGEAYLRLRDIERARVDCMQSWSLDDTHVDHGWMTLWIEMCLGRPSEEMAEQLVRVAQADPTDYDAYLCRAVARWLQGSASKALFEIEQALQIDANRWAGYFWKGMVCATLRRDEEAVNAFERSLIEHIPPILMAPLQWFEQDRPDFYLAYAAPLLKR